MKLFSTASMISMVALASAKNTMLRQQSLGASTSDGNYFGVAHLHVDNPNDFDVTSTFDWVRASSTVTPDFNTLNFSEYEGAEGLIVDDYLDNQNFYLQFDDPLFNNNASKSVYFRFHPKNKAPYTVELAAPTEAGPANCRGGGQVWADLDRAVTKAARGTTLYKFDDEQEDIGVQFQFKCWPTEADTWIDETETDANGNYKVRPVNDQDDCGGRDGSFEQYVVTLAGRAHDSECDFVKACDGKGTSTYGTDYGQFCDDPLDKVGYPNNQCNGKCTDCVNPCENTQYFVQTEATCGVNRKNAANTGNEQNRNKQNVANAFSCVNITQPSDRSDGSWYQVSPATRTADAVYAACGQNEYCDGTNTKVACNGHEGKNKYNPGLPNDNTCQLSEPGYEANSFGNGTVACEDGEFSIAGEACQDSDINKEPNAGKTDQVACQQGWTSGLGEECAACPSGTYAKAGSAEFLAGNCTNCDAGKFSSAGSITCSECPPRHYATSGQNANEAPCERCPDGEVALADGTACKPVGIQHYQDASDTPVPCLAGSQTQRNGEFVDDGKATECVTCESLDDNGDKFFDDDDDSNTACVKITAGKKRNGTNTNVLVECDAGTFSAEGQDTCTDCAAGKHTAGQDTQAACADCPEGTFTGVTGTSVCETPQAGYYASSKTQEDYCGNGKYSHATNRTLCVDRTTTLNLPSIATSDDKIRLQFNLDAEHVEVARTRCPAEEEVEDEVSNTGADDTEAEAVKLAAVARGNIGFCKCKVPFGGAVGVQTDDTTGCANANKQCVAPLSCAGSCNRKDRETDNNCEVVYAKTTSGVCVGYHGDIPTKWSETWAVDANDFDCSQAVVSTLPVLNSA